MSNRSSEEDNESALNEGIEEEEKPEIRKIFINHVNSYQGKAIAKKLPNVKNHASSPSGKLYEIYGSMQTSDEIDNEVVENYAPRILDRKKSGYILEILECDIIVYDISMHNSQVAEAQKVLDTLEMKLRTCKPEPNEPVKYFILISTPMVWAKTPVNDAAPIVEKDYRNRRPHSCYMKHQYLEREVINAQMRNKDRLRTIVICPGIMYGGRNDVLHYIFKKAFYNKESINVYQNDLKDQEYIPLVYIKDFAQMIFNIIEDFPPFKQRYIFAVQSKLLAKKTFAAIVAKSIAGNPIKVKAATKDEILATTDISQRVYHYMGLNLKMVPTYFKDFEFSFGDDLDAMGDQLAEEYRHERNLLPIKIIVDGPPCSGKTSLCKALAEHYEVHYIDPKSVIYNVIKSLEMKIEETDKYLGRQTDGDKTGFEGEGIEEEEPEPQKEVAEVSSELIKISEYLIDQVNKWKGELADLTEYIQTIGEEDEQEFSYIKQCLVEILSSKSCSENQGYIIDSFPFEYNQVAEIFPPSVFRTGEKEEKAAGEEDEATAAVDNEEEEEQDDEAQHKTGSNMKPGFFIQLIANDEVLCKRAMSLSEKEAIETQNTEDQMLARLAKYRERTEEDLSCVNYFIDHDMSPIVVRISQDLSREQLADIVKKQIGTPHTYPLTRTQMEEIARQEMHEKQQREAEEMMRREQIERDEAIARERKIEEWTQKFEYLKEQEQEILEAKSLPLRSYLCKYVLPTLTDGLLQVAQVKPDDPIDFLAEYLFRVNPTGHILEPAYDDEAKRLLLNLDCNPDNKMQKTDDNDSKETIECDDSFVMYQLNTKGSHIYLNTKALIEMKNRKRRDSREANDTVENQAIVPDEKDDGKPNKRNKRKI